MDKNTVWPHAKRATAADRRAVAANLGRMLEARKMSPRDLARALPVSPGLTHKWANGRSLPTHQSAAKVAKLFGVEPAALLKRAGNGLDTTTPHSVTMHKTKPGRAPVVLLPLPDGAPPAAVKLETYPGNAHFMAIAITGTVQVEVALSLLAMLHPEPPPAD